MLENLTVGYLTGSARVTQNYLHKDLVEWRERRNLSQMFFQPYESPKEFIFCARHTFIPMAIIGLAILDPLVMVGVPLIIGGAAAALLAFSAFCTLADCDNAASSSLALAEYLITDLCQAIIDLVVLPLSVLAMVTRGISTGLQATGIYDYDAPETPAPAMV